MTGQRTINFVEGEGISIQAGPSVDGDAWNVEIATTVTDSSDGGAVEWEDTGVSGTSTKWLPLTTTDAAGDDMLVFDADHSLIPTFVPF
jgi:hypothetical protein